MKTKPSIAHKFDMNLVGQHMWPDGLVPWQNRGSQLACGYCGSMHPSDVVVEILAGTKGEWADCKYGWPHKYYFDHGKFYTIHLQDATVEERVIIEQFIGLTFDFTDDGKVGWRQV